MDMQALHNSELLLLSRTADQTSIDALERGQQGFMRETMVFPLLLGGFMNSKKRATFNLIAEIDNLRNEINNILNTKDKLRYFEGIALTQGFIEDLLKWLVYTKIIYKKTVENVRVSDGELAPLREYCNQLTFHGLLNMALAISLINYQLYKRLNDLRHERNGLVHQYWLHEHKGRWHILRKKLEKLANAANDLVSVLNGLLNETGVFDEFTLVSTGRHFVTL